MWILTPVGNARMKHSAEQLGDKTHVAFIRMENTKWGQSLANVNRQNLMS